VRRVPEDLLLIGASGGPPLGSWAGIVTVLTGVVLVAVLVHTQRDRFPARATMENVMPQQIPTVPASELPEDAVVLDVREDDEWVHGHIDGATHIPMGEVPARLDELPEGDPLYVTCRGGGRSARVAAWLNQNGYDAVNVAGGMGEWEAAGKPMVSETGEPPFVR
jgi:rhodanese-related sulfurtransferase